MRTLSYTENKSWKTITRNIIQLSIVFKLLSSLDDESTMPGSLWENVFIMVSL